MSLSRSGSVSSAYGSFVHATSHCDLLCAFFAKTPEWLDSDSCQKCDQPFFWNFKQMWDSKKIGLRQVSGMRSSIGKGLNRVIVEVVFFPVMGAVLE